MFRNKNEAPFQEYGSGNSGWGGDGANGSACELGAIGCPTRGRFIHSRQRRCDRVHMRAQLGTTGACKAAKRSMGAIGFFGAWGLMDSAVNPEKAADHFD